MPTTTFFNLPQEKKDKIIAAVKKEFARVPYEKVSINKIVQNAGISRGSFYMYFTDKKDMLEYILSRYNDETKLIIKKSFEQNKGDIFAVFCDILNFTAEFGTAEDNIAFCMNIFSSHMVQNDIISRYTARGRKNVYFNLFKQHIDTRRLNLRHPGDVDDMIEILIGVTQKAIVDIFLNIKDKNEILKEYNNKMTILKHGMLKEST